MVSGGMIYPEKADGECLSDKHAWIIIIDANLDAFVQTFGRLLQANNWGDFGEHAMVRLI